MADWSAIVPSVLDQAPTDLFEITYPTFTIALGQEIKPGDILDPPSLVNWPNIDPNANYVMSLAELDPNDVGSYQYKQVNLGLAVNIPGGYITKGYVVAPYCGPRPKDGTGLHRYLITVFKQSGLIINVPLAVDDMSRHNFDIRKFAKDYNLGQPVAGTYFVAQADDYTRNYWANNFSIHKSGSVSFKCTIA